MRLLQFIGLFITVILGTIRPHNAARILGLFPHTGRSHQMVFEPLLKELALRGNNVTVVSFFPLDKPPPNYRDISLRGMAPIGIETVDVQMFEDDDTGVLRRIAKIPTFFPLADMAIEVCEKLVQWPELKEVFQDVGDYDVVLIENFNSDCMLGLAHAYGMTAPVIALLTSSMLPWSYERLGVDDNTAYVPSASSDFSDEMSFAERLENTFIHHVVKLWYRYFIQIKEQEIIEKHVGRKLSDLSLLAKNTSLMLVNTHYSFNGARPSVPGLIEVGGMHITKTRNPLPVHIEKFLNQSEHGVILFSLGSLIKTSTLPKYKEDLIVETLAKFPQRIIWKHESSEQGGTITGNILRLQWIPQRDLLNHPKVIAYIGHGGLLGMTEAIHAGVPMLVIPFFGDQPGNGAAAERAGFAKVLQYGDINKHSFYKSLQEVLRPEMRKNAARLSTIWLDRPMSPLETAVYWVERTSRLGHVPNTSTGARYLSMAQLNLIDVSLTILLGIITLLVVCLFVVKLIINLLLKITNIFNKRLKEKDN